MREIHQGHSIERLIKDRIYGSNPVPVIEMKNLAIREETIYGVI